MKKYTEILAEIAKTKKLITDAAKEEKELCRLAAKEAYTNGTPEELEKARTEYKAAEARYIKECEKNTDLKLKIEILTDNAKNAFFAENINVICEIWNRYEGKPHGEKTRDKIREELKAATGFYISIGNKYRDASIAIYSQFGDSAPFRDLEFCPIRNGRDQPAIDSNNKILSLSPDNFRVCLCGGYVENVNAHIKALKKAHKAAEDAEKALADAIKAYNELTRGKINRASAREGVKNWYI